ncbi:peroxisomal membrane anchor protein conserved region-domain-containing protein [Chaetomidium leptoderma]|uniref:Peroxisomal membrane protein PEX14 n=1 Tax=Chaetomidium leptoderma TaxID=669021 RepID=A0AAN6VLQ6_9PEZI|nr:peroxisomal membrane anchor protein conserved region-domain-containing protein [Chaetomidium leptoderma]
MSEPKGGNKQEVLAAPPDEPSAEPATEPSTSREEALEQARKFLQDVEVQNTTPERKAEFLKGKGLSESDIEELLKEVTHDGRQESQASNQTKEGRIEIPLTKKEDRPPIVTYPEFLTKPTRPPPLVTVNGFLDTLYAFGGLSTLVYGASKFVVEPMVNRLTDARISLHDTANQDLTKLVSKLETTVSEIPASKPKDAKTLPADGEKDDDAVSSYDDPTELFHRDIGVQTSLPTSPSLSFSPSATTETATARQAHRLASLITSLQSLNESIGEQTESLGDVQTATDLLKQDADKLSAAASSTDFVGGFSLYSAVSKNEPDDEIKRAKENIRRVKGVLLSTRSFPTSTR